MFQLQLLDRDLLGTRQALDVVHTDDLVYEANLLLRSTRLADRVTDERSGPLPIARERHREHSGSAAAGAANTPTATVAATTAAKLLTRLVMTPPPFLSLTPSRGAFPGRSFHADASP